MNKFIYCADENLKDNLLSQGFNLINHTKINNCIVWIFENSEKVLKYMQFDLSNQSKYFVSNTLNFHE